MERKKREQEGKASGESSNYAEVELIVPNPSPSPPDHIIMGPVRPLTLHRTAAPQTECTMNRNLFVSLHIRSGHVASKWVQMPSKDHVPAGGSIRHTWDCVDTVLGEGLSCRGGGRGLGYLAFIQSDSVYLFRMEKEVV